MKVLFFIVGLVAIASDAFASGPYPATWTFDAYREGQPIGYHKLTFEHSKSGSQTVTTDVDIALQKLGVTVYRYRHHATEVWQDGQLQKLDTITDDNGVSYTVAGRRTTRGLEVERTASGLVAPAAVPEQGLQRPEVSRETFAPDTLPTSLWSVEGVRRSVVLNSQYGKLSHIKVETVGREPVRLQSGEKSATRYRVTGDLQMELWFDDDGRWLKANFRAPDGSIVEYVLRN